MIYKQFKELELSCLGMGAMRLPTKEINGQMTIDTKAAEEMIAYAYEQGINYFDTAWGYHNGESELVLGKALARFPRESWYLADKFPGYDLNNMDKAPYIFEEQLGKCAVDYFDFYLIHNVCEMNIDAYLDEQYGIRQYFVEQKAGGTIRHLGFSAHGSVEVMRRFLDSYGDNMEFCQLQLNFLDWEFQDAKAKVALLEEYQIPVWVMEPMRGGQLATLSQDDALKLKTLRPTEKITAWSFRFIQSLPGVVVTLTGASTMEQLRGNILAYQEEKALSDNEMEILLQIGRGIVAKTSLPCTACRYCVEHCPQHL
ncbi:MAG: aldo/keto reductase, partial [Lachnospiraceae bacterium]|nr:aldo/keto reductase [Lachnospiraceae bacterium]